MRLHAGYGLPCDDHRPGPLDGILIADFSRVLAGPYCTMLLADLGATVIKVESPHGDDTRLWRPPVRDGVSTYYLAINRNKRSVILDFKQPEDLSLATGVICPGRRVHRKLQAGRSQALWPGLRSGRRA